MWKEVIEKMRKDFIRRFTSENELVKALSRYETLYNNTYRKVLNFKSANEMVEEFMKKAS